jgi:hypothetical protein
MDPKIEGKKLFKYYLDQYEHKHNTRPEFFYRMHRSKFQTMVMRPVSFFAPWYSTSGYLFKGAVIYLVYYWVFKSQPHTKHWNREGYVYEITHKTPNAQF